MRKLGRWLAWGLGAVALLLLVATTAVYALSQRQLSGPSPRAERLDSPTPAQLADIGRQARVLGCVGCHGEGLRGSLFLDDAKLARVWAPNLTRVAAQATDQQLAAAIRQGIGTDGRALFIMPSAQYSLLGDREVAALIRYMRSLPVGGETSPARRIGPLGRIGIVTAEFKSAPALVSEYSTREPIRLGPATERGRQLTRRACIECHGPDLAGLAVTPDEVAPDLSIVGSYDLAAFRTLLRTGVAPGDRRLTLMGDVARANFAYLTDEEIASIHAYLQARAQR